MSGERHAVETAIQAPVLFDRVRQMFCGINGHDSLLQFEHARMFLKCSSCGHETPGWELNEAPPTPFEARRAGERRATLVRPHLVGARRIA